MEKIKNKKEGKINSIILIFFCTMNLATLNVYTKSEDPDFNRS